MAEKAQSSENIDVVRRSLDAYARRDLEEMRAVNAADVVLDWSESRSWLAGVYRGLDDVMRFYADYYEAFSAITIEAESFTPIGDFVVVPNVARQRGRDGIEVTARATFVFSVRNGLVTRIRLYQEKADALKAIRLAQGE